MSARMMGAVLCACCCIAISAGPQPGTGNRDDRPDDQSGAPPRPAAPAGERADSQHDAPVPAQSAPLAAAQPRPAITAEDAAAIVLQAYGGRIVHQAPATGANGEPGHRLRVDVDGRIKTVFVDAAGRLTEQPARQRDAPADR